MTYLLDTNVCFRIINGRSAVARQELFSHHGSSSVNVKIPELKWNFFAGLPNAQE